MVSISIIIPVFNVEEYIRRCLLSVFNQDVNDLELECIIVNDKTQDDSMKIVRQMINEYNGAIQFKILEHKYNRGLSAARNTGLNNAKGDYIFFMDSDDHLVLGCFQYFKEKLKLYPKVDMMISNARNCKNGDLLIHYIQTPLLLDDTTIIFQRMLRHKIYLYAWNKLIRRELLINNNIFFEDGIIYEDQCWSYGLFSHLSSILLLPKVTYIYENNPLSIVNTSFTPERSELVLKSYIISTNIILDNPPNPHKYKNNMVVDYLMFMMFFMMNGVDIYNRFSVSKPISLNYKKVRMRLYVRSLKYGRFIMSLFFLLLFPPLCHIQKLKVFRHHYFEMDAIFNRFFHLFDFLHCKSRV